MMAYPHIPHESRRSLVNPSALSGVDWSKEDQPWYTSNLLIKFARIEATANPRAKA